MVEEANRKQPKEFEPPPWEQDQFDELARRREELQKETELDEALAAMAVSQAQQKQESSEEREVEEAAGEEGEPKESGGSGENAVDAKLMESMLTQLKMEEPANDPSLWKVSVALSSVSILIGLMLVVWGVAALVRNTGEATGVIGGAILLLFGGFFIGLGGWMAVRSLKERGAA